MPATSDDGAGAQQGQNRQDQQLGSAFMRRS
jgi:hypothetical protein